MAAYRIDRDFTILRFEDDAAEMNARGRDRSCLGYDHQHDIWCNDWISSRPT
jgi:hypothetical protein